MLGRIIEIEQEGRYLHKQHGFMVVMAGAIELGRIPLDDLGGVIANARGLTYSNNLLVELGQRGVPLVVCGQNHLPAAVLWSADSNYEQSGRIDAQIEASVPTKKRLWKQVVKAKLLSQARVLSALSKPSQPLLALMPKVRAGDPENIEAQAARRYWTLLFGSDFRRDRSSEGINSLLNYGYTVLRAATARSVMGAGLHPGIGIHHSNTKNAMRLVDDLMEPFRAYVDVAVQACFDAGKSEVDSDVKKALAGVIYWDLPSVHGVSPLFAHLSRLAVSLAQVFAGERPTLEIADPPTHERLFTVSRWKQSNHQSQRFPPID